MASDSYTMSYDPPQSCNDPVAADSNGSTSPLVKEEVEVQASKVMANLNTPNDLSSGLGTSLNGDEAIARNAAATTLANPSHEESAANSVAVSLLSPAEVPTLLVSAQVPSSASTPPANIPSALHTLPSFLPPRPLTTAPGSGLPLIAPNPSVSASASTSTPPATGFAIPNNPSRLPQDIELIMGMIQTAEGSGSAAAAAAAAEGDKEDGMEVDGDSSGEDEDSDSDESSEEDSDDRSANLLHLLGGR